MKTAGNGENNPLIPTAGKELTAGGMGMCVSVRWNGETKEWSGATGEKECLSFPPPRLLAVRKDGHEVERKKRAAITNR